MRIIITGGAGFIGSNIARELSKKHDIKIIDNLSTGSIDNLCGLGGKVKLVKKSITDLKALEKEFKGYDYVLHLAAIPSVQRSVEDPLGTAKVNITGTLNVLSAARKCDIKRVVYSASSSAYGNAKKLPKVETMPTDPLSPYAAQKLMGEIYSRQFFELYGLDTVSLRYFNVFGPHQNPNSEYAAVIPKFIKLILNNKRPVIFGNGKQSRDFSYIDNIISANLKSLTTKHKLKGEVINIACGERINLLQLVSYINSGLGKGIKPLFKPARQGDVMHSLADIRKARKLIGYRPLIDFKSGLERSIQWYQVH